MFHFLSTWSLALVIQTNGTENFSRFGKKGKKVIPRKVLLFLRIISTRMNRSIWILPGISGFSIQMVSTHRHDWCTIYYGMFHFLSTPPPLPRPPCLRMTGIHTLVFLLAPFEKLNPKSSFFVSSVDTFVHRGWVICPPSLEWEREGEGEGRN